MSVGPRSALHELRSALALPRPWRYPAQPNKPGHKSRAPRDALPHYFHDDKADELVERRQDLQRAIRVR